MKPLFAPFSRVLGWVWVVVAALLLIDVLLNGRDHASVIAAAVLLVTLGGDYVLWLRPRVVPTEAGVRIINPMREAFVPWSAFTWADVTDVLRVHAGDQVFRSWPLRETKRAKVRENLRRADGPIDLGADTDVRDLRPVELAARQLREEAERRKARSAPPAGEGGVATAEGAVAGEPAVLWSPDAVVAVGVPLLLLVAAILLG
ncbi:PH (Pleckstrin Homology) domain-containing protein [Murinocardiopsis flavida]|uniref:PH (Pleckstrin Homology) domain-containing protein n=1 Tax=Murinocardiopsis flavida TaxID=645275 RepID=A0A2P8DIG8_9ACTN|nr:PH domain-containing protein [Murinocardiopsis flavida]PSK97020.1 PH (Pleckstrin Homology) domain-containing protein [Murinocardiopsis flavida]